MSVQQSGYIWSEVENDKMASKGGGYTLTRVVEGLMDDPTKLHEEIESQLKVRRGYRACARTRTRSPHSLKPEPEPSAQALSLSPQPSKLSLHSRPHPRALAVTPTRHLTP